MSYFNELPNISTPSLLPNRTRNDEMVLVKNLFKRAKLRTDFDSVITAFDFATISDGDRPDTIAESVYGDPELDWVILITNNITNLRERWPLSHDDLYKYMLDKYGSDQAMYEVHHYRSMEIRDEFGRVVMQAGYEVDEDFTVSYLTASGSVRNNIPAAGPVSNYEYETDLNNSKKIIKILKPEYVSAMISDMRKMMKYQTSSQFFDKVTKVTYNPRENGV